MLVKDTRVLRYVRAGHDMPIVVSGGGGAVRLEDGGIMLGFVRDADFHVSEIELRPNDVLCMYTNGVTEARSPGDEEFQTERLLSVLKASREKDAGRIVGDIIESVTRFTEEKNQADDVTVLVLRVEG
ncbi:MAG: PP2C family protein-serine/threonine phosphatase [bacterium]